MPDKSKTPEKTTSSSARKTAGKPSNGKGAAPSRASGKRAAQAQQAAGAAGSAPTDSVAAPLAAHGEGSGVRSLFSPVTAPTRVDYAVLENDVQRWWDERGILEKYLHRNDGADKRWSFQDGPITANNPMGVHHAWGRTYKDLYQRFNTMRGYRQRYQNGFDNQGLWVEVEVEKELGFKNKRQIEEYGIARFVEKCKERT
ncbi:MAG: class I tRNA ligase family protein, partial [Ktedonobacterales bacterium]